MDYEVLQDSHPQVRLMLEAKADWEVAIANRKDCEKRYDIAVLEGKTFSQIAMTDPAIFFLETAKLKGKIMGLEKVNRIEKQVEAAEERKYKAAYKALFDDKEPDYYKDNLLVAFAEGGFVCAGHFVEVLDIEERETLEVFVKLRSEVPLVQALYKRRVGESVQILLQGHCTRYKITGVRVSRNDK